jgi:hypothetical protein
VPPMIGPMSAPAPENPEVTITVNSDIMAHTYATHRAETVENKWIKSLGFG